MADISILLRLLNGVARNVDISANTLVTSSIKVGGGGDFGTRRSDEAVEFSRGEHKDPRTLRLRAPMPDD